MSRNQTDTLVGYAAHGGRGHPTRNGAPMRIAIASDHAGFIQKDPLADYLRGRGHDLSLIHI